MPTDLGSPYDEIAGMYDRVWRDWYLPAALPALEKLFFSRVPRGARILDLCCGSGHVTKELARRGYRVTGIDSSAGLIALARKHLPGVDLRVQDARRLKLEGQYDAAISTFDSLNHILTMKELREVFVRVHGSLKREGLFVFDMNLEEAYAHELREWMVDRTEDSVSLARGSYDPVSKKAATELIWFVNTGHDGVWRQHQSAVEQRCYEEREILLAAGDAGFREVGAIPARDAGVTAELGFGRIFFVARA